MCVFRAKNCFFKKRGRYAGVYKKTDNRGDVGEKKRHFFVKKARYITVNFR